ncbi:FecR domain-containing protein [Candidatus Neomarinimicrobiota bacterium]
MKRILVLTLLIVLSVAYGADKVALATKVSGQVSLVNLQNAKSPLKRNTILETGMKIETGPDGVAVIMFIDDKSILRVQRDTYLTVGGERSATAISKQIDMQFGKLRAEVAEQRQGEFQISTPTSVASVKGTDFWTTSDPVYGDIFLGVSGLIEVENLISGGIINVGGGQVGESKQDGTTDVANYVLLVGEILTAADNLLTLDPVQLEDGTQFNGRVVLDASTSFAGPVPVVASTATISGKANDDGSILAIQIEIEEVEVDTEPLDVGEVEPQTGGSTEGGSSLFTAVDGNFAATGVTTQDSLVINSGANTGRYEIVDVGDNTLTIGGTFAATEAGIDYEISRNIIAPKELIIQFRNSEGETKELLIIYE